MTHAEPNKIFSVETLQQAGDVWAAFLIGRFDMKPMGRQLNIKNVMELEKMGYENA